MFTDISLATKANKSKLFVQVQRWLKVNADSTCGNQRNQEQIKFSFCLFSAVLIFEVCYQFRLNWMLTAALNALLG